MFSRSSVRQTHADPRQAPEPHSGTTPRPPTVESAFTLDLADPTNAQRNAAPGLEPVAAFTRHLRIMSMPVPMD